MHNDLSGGLVTGAMYRHKKIDSGGWYRVANKQICWILQDTGFNQTMQDSLMSFRFIMPDKSGPGTVI
jgi:hypothetical protein